MGARECRDQRACQSVGRAAAHAPGRPPPPPIFHPPGGLALSQCPHCCSAGRTGAGRDLWRPSLPGHAAVCRRRDPGRPRARRAGRRRRAGVVDAQVGRADGRLRGLFHRNALAHAAHGAVSSGHPPAARAQRHSVLAWHARARGAITCALTRLPPHVRMRGSRRESPLVTNLFGHAVTFVCASALMARSVPAAPTPLSKADLGPLIALGVAAFLGQVCDGRRGGGGGWRVAAHVASPWQRMRRSPCLPAATANPLHPTHARS